VENPSNHIHSNRLDSAFLEYEQICYRGNDCHGIRDFCITIGHIGGIGIVVSHEILHYQDKYSYIAGTLNLSKSMHCFSNIYMDTTKTWLPSYRPVQPNSVLFPSTKHYRRLPQLLAAGKGAARAQAQGWLRPCQLHALVLSSLYPLFTGCMLVMDSKDFLVQAFWGVVLLEVISYLEHYGLQRKETAPGVYELTSISTPGTPHS